MPIHYRSEMGKIFILYIYSARTYERDCNQSQMGVCYKEVYIMDILMCIYNKGLYIMISSFFYTLFYTVLPEILLGLALL